VDKLNIFQQSFKIRTGLSEGDLELLRGLPLLAGLDAQSIEALLRDARVERHDSRNVLFIEGDAADRFYVILEGWVKLFRDTASGQESVIAVFGRGESFAEAAMFGSGRMPVSAAAIARARLLVVPAGSFIARIRENSEYALRMMASMSAHLHHLVNQIEQLTVRSTTERLASFLLRLSPASEGDVEITLPVEKHLIAGRLGMQPETLSRSFAKLREVGVETASNNVRIADIGQLRRFVLASSGSEGRA
jgi:CRP-like cAMP-binding protein